MKQKKIIIFIILISTLLLTLYKVANPQLIPTARKIVKLINTQEDKSDCTCWSTVRIMEFHEAKLPLSANAMAIKIEAMKALLWQFWREYTVSDQPIDQFIDSVYWNNISEIKEPIPSKFDENLPIKRLQKYHYHRLTEHYRYLLSIIFDIVADDFDPKDFKDLSIKEIKAFATLSTHLNSELLKTASQLALERRQSEVLTNDIKDAYNKIKKQSALKGIETNHLKTDFRYLFFLKKFSEKIAKNKINSLKKYNQSIWDNPVNFKNQASLLSTIFNMPIREDELKLIIMDFIDDFIWLFYPSDISRADNIKKPKVSRSKMNTEKLAYSILKFETEYNLILQAFPFKLKRNGDIIVKHEVESETPFSIQYKNLEIRSYTLDSVRDTIIHWSIISMIQKNYRTSILDPFALEILAERISEYIAVILMISKETKGPVIEDIRDSKILKTSFIQINNIKNTWTEKNKQIPINRFKEKASIETDYDFSQNENKIKTYGYFNGITSVDINQNGRQDIIIPSNYYIDILFNTDEGFKRKRIFEKSETEFNSVYAIDINNDYKLDIIGVGPEGIHLFIQESINTFTLSKNILIKNAFSLCANDIDLDGDIDLYVTAITLDSPTLGGRNADENKLLINNGKGNFTIKNIPEIESKGYSLTCSILDINNDSLNDILVINDFGRDELFIQKPNFKFQNMASSLNFDDAGAGMNLSIVDFNNDDYWDAYITIIDMFNKQLTFHLPLDSSQLSRDEKIIKTETYLVGNQMYIGTKNKFKRKTESIFEPGPKGWGWGSTFFDYDNDGDKDIYITNGEYEYLHTKEKIEKNIFMINENGKLFYSNSLSKESEDLNSRAVIATDTNNDGKLDLWVKTPTHAIEFTNRDKSNSNWLKIKLIGLKDNTYAIGSIIKVTTDKKTYRDIILPQTGYLSQEPYLKHFGLGNETVQSIEITWPNKRKTIIQKPIKLNQVLMEYHPEIIL